MKEETEKGIDYGTLGIVLGVVFVIMSIILVTMLSFSQGEDKSGDGVTWVG